MIFKPTADRVLIKMVERTNEDPEKMGALFIPAAHSQQQKLYYTGEVIDVGPGVRFYDGKIHAPPFKAGQNVSFHPHSAQVVKREEAENEKITYMILREGDVLGTD